MVDPEMDYGSDGKLLRDGNKHDIDSSIPSRKENATFVPLLGIYSHADEGFERKNSLYTPCLILVQQIQNVSDPLPLSFHSRVTLPLLNS